MVCVCVSYLVWLLFGDSIPISYVFSFKKNVFCDLFLLLYLGGGGGGGARYRAIDT